MQAGAEGPPPSGAAQEEARGQHAAAEQAHDPAAGIAGAAPATAPDTHAIASSARLLSYERQMIEDMVEEDALCILSSGMGWQKMVAVLVRLHAHSQPGVVLILGCQPWQRDLICREVKRHDPGVEAPVEISNEIPALERIELYKTPTCCFVTTRILVVDLLCSRVLPRNIAGMIVVNAHRLTDASGEAFAVRLYRGGNATGFVRAVSDQPTAFTSGFNKVEKVMRALHVRRLILWPRFHQYVQDELDAAPPEVIEWEQELSPAMLDMQGAITEILDSLIKDLRRTNKIDCSDLKLENGLSRSFDEIIRRQLDPIWHTIGRKPKQLCRDLRTLRQIALHLVHYDAVTFLSFLEGLRQSESKDCLWLFHDAAHLLFEMARRRVYLYTQPAKVVDVGQVQQRQQEGNGEEEGMEEDGKEGDGKGKGRGKGKGKAAGAAGAVGGRKRKLAKGSEGEQLPAATAKPPLEMVLEEMPKWSLLVHVLQEVQQRRREWREAGAAAAGTVTQANAPPGTQHTTEEEAGASGAAATAAAPAAAGSSGDPAIHTTSDRAAPPATRCSASPSGAAALAAMGSAPVLVVAREPHMCAQLEQVVRLGGKAVMQAMYEAYLMTSLKRPAAAAATTGAQGGTAGTSGRGGGGGNQRRGGYRGRGGRGGRGRGALTSGQESWSAVSSLLGLGPNLRPGEQQALRLEAGRLERQRAAAAAGGGAVEGEAAVQGGRKRGGRGRGRGRGRGGGEEGGVRGGKVPRRKHRDDSPPPPLLGDAEAGQEEGKRREGSGSEDKEEQAGPSGRGGGTAANAGRGTGGRKAKAAATAAASASGLGPAGLLAATAPPGCSSSQPPCELLDGVHFYALDSRADDVLWTLRPSAVVLYEPDLAFIRQVEVYQAERGGPPIVVHHLTHARSLEGQAHLNAVERERQAMSSLIEFKAHIVIPVGLAPGQQMVSWTPDPASGDLFAANQLTRHGGAGAPRAAPRRLVVDMREFMSGLPAVLHQRGFELCPVTLEVGDYVLSPELVVERKAIPDLHSSMASGRLYHQAEAMSKHYKTPILLIEFDPERQFTLQSVSDLGDSIDAKNIVSKLVLLLLHFPKLRLVWSRSPHATADTFAALKSNQDEPDAAAAAAVGVPLGAAGTGVTETLVNQTAQDLLRRLPGVTDATFRPLMAAAGSLRGLADMSLQQLEAVMGAKAAKVLREFLDTPCPRG